MEKQRAASEDDQGLGCTQRSHREPVVQALTSWASPVPALPNSGPVVYPPSVSLTSHQGNLGS